MIYELVLRNFDCSLEFVFSLLLLQAFNFSPVSFACNFQDWGCVILREIDFLLKICWSIPCLHPSWKVHTYLLSVECLPPQKLFLLLAFSSYNCELSRNVLMELLTAAGVLVGSVHHMQCRGKAAPHPRSGGTTIRRGSTIYIVLVS